MLLLGRFVALFFTVRAWLHDWLGWLPVALVGIAPCEDLALVVAVGADWNPFLGGHAHTPSPAGCRARLMFN